MNSTAELVLIYPGNNRQLRGEYVSDIEPPYWLALIAGFLRKNGIGVVIVDANAENLSPLDTAVRVSALNPLLSAVLVYGCHPSASTQNMTAAIEICKALKENPLSKVVMGGPHPTALPEKTLKEAKVDFVIEGEEFQPLNCLVKALRTGGSDLSQVPGLWYHGNGKIMNNPRPPLLNDLDESLSSAAWDLLPMNKYRAQNFHCLDRLEKRMPYAAIYTSLGCPYPCVFCCANALFGGPGIRYRDPALVVKEIDVLVNRYGVQNIKIMDYLFVSREEHYMKIIDQLLARDYGLNIWAYARVDTIKPENLIKMKKAGINWLALGIESAYIQVKSSMQKKQKINNVREIVRNIQGAGIGVMGNFIFGLPDDTLKTMQATLDLAIELNCEFANFYCAMAYPGSKLYAQAVENKWPLPTTWAGFSQHSYETLPLPTKHVSAAQVLSFRDRAFHVYFENPTYLNMIEKKFGQSARRHIEAMTKVKLKRQLLESEI